VWSVCLCASACPVCPVCVPAPPGVFLPVPVIGTGYMKHCNKDLAVAAEHQVARNETPGSRSAPMRGRHSPMTLTRAHQSASEKKTPQGL